MEIKFTAVTIIEGNIALQKPIYVQYGLYGIEMFIEDGKYKLSVSKKINVEYADIVELSQNGETPSLTLSVDKYLDEKMLDIFRHIEAFGGFMNGITKVCYSEFLDLSWIDVVKNEVIFSVQKVLNKPKCILFTEKRLSDLMFDKRLIPDAKSPYNFYREATGYFNKMDFISSYLHFYMILEICFADGKFSNEQKKNFKKASTLKLAVLSTLDIIKTNDNDLYQRIAIECSTRNKALNFDSIVDILYNYRGELSHAPKRAIYEECPEKLRPITEFIFSVCYSVCGYMKVYCDKLVSADFKAKRINERIQELEQRLNLV